MDIAALNEFPIPMLGRHQTEFQDVVGEIVEMTVASQARGEKAGAWLRHEIGLTGPRNIAIVERATSAEKFVSMIREILPKRRKLSANDIAELKREFLATIEPLQQSRSEIFTLENRLFNLLNMAYGITPEEVDLMWHTAPPRMPFTPAGLTIDEDLNDTVSE